MKFTTVFKPLDDTIGPNDPITIVATGKNRSDMKQKRSLTMLVHYLHDVLNVPYGQIIVLLGLEDKEKIRENEMEELLGSYLTRKCTVIQNDAAMTGFAVGKTRKGCEVAVNPLLIRRKVILAGEELKPVTSANKLSEEEIREAMEKNVSLELQFNITNDCIRKEEMIRELDYFKTIRKDNENDADLAS